MSSENTCVCCSGVVPSDKLVTCCACKCKYKYTCVNLSLSEVRSITSKKGLMWNCSACANLGNDLSEIKLMLVQLQREITALKECKSYNNNAIDEDQFEALVNETSERNRRSFNIIVYNAKEPLNDTNNYNKSEDTTLINNIFEATIGVPCSPSSFDLFRLGKPDTLRTKPRPLKIVFKDNSLPKKILLNCRKLKDSANLKNLNITEDRTPRQQKYYQGLKVKLLEREKNGEKNLKIKYINGVPQIVSLN